jgi:GNAT superfamily N-acetyltransferase
MIDARTFTVEDTLRDGTRVTIRAVRPDDQERIARAFGQLERESVYTRFFSYKKELTAEELAQLDDIDFVREVMLVVTTQIDSEELVIASARYVAEAGAAGERWAEVAFTIEENYQGLGIAGRLLRHLIAIARASSIVRFQADFLSGNKAMLAVFARSGLPIQQQRESGVVHLTLDLVPRKMRGAAGVEICKDDHRDVKR